MRTEREGRLRDDGLRPSPVTKRRLRRTSTQRWRAARLVDWKELAYVSLPSLLQHMRLLCADDEADIRTILELALGLDPDLQVEIVESGQDALARAKETRFDAILLDGMMPGLDGYETCRRLKADKATADVPVVFLTAKTQRDEVARALEIGAVACLTKPFDPLTIAAEVRRALATE